MVYRDNSILQNKKPSRLRLGLLSVVVDAGKRDAVQSRCLQDFATFIRLLPAGAQPTYANLFS
jgi:hypothetical protein